ncbi:hypothetical protein DFJ73DRAFT_959372 [Zopfochytrium polystomum]|nr:hypothetical protein DFJ73DRAFT_959372 [Zopfochytrium polystomum]
MSTFLSAQHTQMAWLCWCILNWKQPAVPCECITLFLKEIVDSGETSFKIWVALGGFVFELACSSMTVSAPLCLSETWLILLKTYSKFWVALGVSFELTCVPISDPFFSSCCQLFFRLCSLRYSFKLPGLLQSLGTGTTCSW